MEAGHSEAGTTVRGDSVSADARPERAPPALTAAVFDWGGTLSVFAEVELHDMWELAARRLADESGLDAVDLQRRLAEAEQRFWQRCDEHWESASLTELLAEESKAIGLDVTEAVLEEVATHHLDSWTPHIRHHDDAVPTLEDLRSRGLRIGLLSNTHWPESFHEHFLERDGLDHLIDVRAYTSTMPRTKPDPSAFRHVLDRLGVDATEAVFVGDRPRDDVWGAQQVGMRGVWKRHRHSPPLGDVVPDATIELLSELPPLVEQWNS